MQITQFKHQNTNKRRKEKGERTQKYIKFNDSLEWQLISVYVGTFAPSQVYRELLQRHLKWIGGYFCVILAILDIEMICQ